MSEFFADIPIGRSSYINQAIDQQLIYSSLFTKSQRRMKSEGNGNLAQYALWHHYRRLRPESQTMAVHFCVL